MIILHCCIVNSDELHIQSCHALILLESWDVGRQRAVDVFLYAFRRTCMQCHVYWSVVCACCCEFWSLYNINTFVRHMGLFIVRIGELSFLVRKGMCLRFQKTFFILRFMQNRRVSVPSSQAVSSRFPTTWGYVLIHFVSVSLYLSQTVDCNQTKGRLMHESLELFHFKMRWVAWPVVRLISFAWQRWCRDTTCWSCFSGCV